MLWRVELQTSESIDFSGLREGGFPEGETDCSYQRLLGKSVCVCLCV